MPDMPATTIALAPAFKTPPLERYRIRQFSIAMRDENPVHLDDEFCRSLGLEGVIAPAGIAVVAMAHAAVKHYGLGAVREVDVSLRAPVAAGERLVCHTAILDDRGTEVELLCRVENEQSELRAEGRVKVSVG